MAMMKKVVIHRPGGYERLVIEEFPIPRPAAGEVVVKVASSGVNYADVVIRWGLYESANKLVGYPITPGFEFAGTVMEVGDGVTTWKEGDEVFGVSFFQANASHVKIPAYQLYPRPGLLKQADAGGFPAVFLTAYHGLFQNIVIRPGMKILVHSAAGGVGGALVQLGNIIGCEMVGVVGASHKVAAVKELGASAVIDKSREDLWDRAREISPKGYDVVFDANGPTTLKDSYDHLLPTGKLVCYGFHSFFPNKGGKLDYLRLLKQYVRTPRFNPLKMSAANKSVITFNLSFLFDRHDLLSEGMHELIRWIQEGKIRSPQVTSFPLEKVDEAHRALESGQTVGKLVLLPG